MALETVVIKIVGDTKEVDSTINKLKKLGKVDKKNADDFEKNSAKVQSSTKKTGGLLDGLGKKAFAMGTAMVGAFAIQQVVGNAIGILRDFEKELSTLQSITGSTTKEMKFFEEAAVSVGRATKTSATEVVKAFTQIGSAQPELLKNSKALAEVTKQSLILSKAAGIDATSAAQSLTGAMNQFGASASDAAKFTDILATSQQKGSSFIVDTTEALVNAGAAASAAGLSFETTNAAIQALAKGNIKGARAGTALRGVLSKLSAQSDDKINPSMVGLSKTLKNLSERNLDLAQATKLVGEEGATGLLTLIKQIELFKNLDGSLNDVGNALNQMAINTNNLDGSLDELNNAWEEWVLGLKSSSGILKGTVDVLTAILRAEDGRAAAARNFKKEQEAESEARVQSLRDHRKRLQILSRETELITGVNEEQEKQVRNLFFLNTAIKELTTEQLKDNTSLSRSREITKQVNKLIEERNDLLGKTKKALKEQLIIQGELTAAERLSGVISVEVEEGKVQGVKETGKTIADEMQERLEREVIIKDTILQGIQATSDLFITLQERRLMGAQSTADKEIDILQEKFDKGLISEKEFTEGREKLEEDFDKMRAEILRKQAIADKAAAAIAAAINTAVAVTKALITSIPLSIAIGALGALKVAAILASPIPKFHKGKKPELNSGEMLSIIRKDEGVIPPKPSKKHKAAVDALVDDRFSKFVFEAYQLPLIKKYSKDETSPIFDDWNITSYQRKQLRVMSEQNKILKSMVNSSKRGGWN